MEEFRTTKLCHGCGSPTAALTEIYNSNPDRDNVSPYPIHGLRWCQPCQTFMDRDVNAARNICERAYLQFAFVPTDDKPTFKIDDSHYLSRSHAAVDTPSMSLNLHISHRDRKRAKASRAALRSRLAALQQGGEV